MDQDLFSVLIEERGHAAHLRLNGELDISTLPVLERSLQGAESNGYTAIVLDLQHLTFTDGSGLGSFIRAAERASRRGRDFSMLNVPAIVRRLLEVTRTTRLLEPSVRAPARSSERSDHVAV